MNPSSRTNSDDVPEEFVIRLREAGLMPTDQAEAVCRFIGLELQGVPKHYRELAIARLRNKAKALMDQSAPPEFVRLIDALCDGWSDFSVK